MPLTDSQSRLVVLSAALCLSLACKGSDGTSSRVPMDRVEVMFGGSPVRRLVSRVPARFRVKETVADTEKPPVDFMITAGLDSRESFSLTLSSSTLWPLDESYRVHLGYGMDDVARPVATVEEMRGGEVRSYKDGGVRMMVDKKSTFAGSGTMTDTKGGTVTIEFKGDWTLECQRIFRAEDGGARPGVSVGSTGPIWVDDLNLQSPFCRNVASTVQGGIDL